MKLYLSHLKNYKNVFKNNKNKKKYMFIIYFFKVRMTLAFNNNYFYDLPQDIQDRITDIKKELILQDEKTKKQLTDKLHYLKNCDDYSDDLTDEMFEMMDVATILNTLVSNYLLYDYEFYPNCYSKDFIVDKLNEAYRDGRGLFNKKEKVIDMVFNTFTKEEVVFMIKNLVTY